MSTLFISVISDFSCNENLALLFQLRPIRFSDFLSSLQRIRASANPEHMKKLAQFNEAYGDVSTTTTTSSDRHRYLTNY